MAAALPAEVRAAIVIGLRAGSGVRELADEHGVAPSTVSKIGSQEQIEVRRAAEADAGLGGRRSKLAADAQDAAEQVLASFADVDWSKVPPDKRAVVFGILVDKVQVLTRNEADGLTVVDGWIRGMLGT